MAKQTGDSSVKKIGVAETTLVSKYSVLKEHIWELQRILGGKKGNHSKTFKNQAETIDNVWSLNENKEEALVLLPTYYERLEAANKEIL